VVNIWGFMGVWSQCSIFGTCTFVCDLARTEKEALLTLRGLRDLERSVDQPGFLKKALFPDKR